MLINSFGFFSVCLVCRSWGRGSCGESTVFLSTCPQTVKTCWRNYLCSTQSNEAVWRYFHRLHCCIFTVICSPFRKVFAQQAACSRAESPNDLEPDCCASCEGTLLLLLLIVNERFNLQSRRVEIRKHYSLQIKEWPYVIIWWKPLEIVNGICRSAVRNKTWLIYQNHYAPDSHCIHAIRHGCSLFSCA